MGITLSVRFFSFERKSIRFLFRTIVRIARRLDHARARAGLRLFRLGLPRDDRGNVAGLAGNREEASKEKRDLFPWVTDRFVFFCLGSERSEPSHWHFFTTFPPWERRFICFPAGLKLD